jgi:hypothetical protein
MSQFKLKGRKLSTQCVPYCCEPQLHKVDYWIVWTSRAFGFKSKILFYFFASDLCKPLKRLLIPFRKDYCFFSIVFEENNFRSALGRFFHLFRYFGFIIVEPFFRKWMRSWLRGEENRNIRYFVRKAWNPLIALKTINFLNF